MTMGMENFWQQLKHNFLHHFTWPCLDKLVFINIYKVNQAYLVQVKGLEDVHHLGCAKELAPIQVYFKKL